MLSSSGVIGATLAAGEVPGWLYTTISVVMVVIGFSIIIFVHELGHFLAAKWVGIRVDRFSVGFGPRLFGYRKGEGFTFGNRPEYKAEELAQKRYGETDYCFKVLAVGGYVKMLGQDDVIINEKTGEVSLSDDPRAFTNRPVGHRMTVVSAGVLFNLLFAAVLLMAVFLVGKDMPAPVIGWVHPDSPAQGQLFPGDRILEMDGRRVDSWFDIRIGSALGDETVRFKIERNGQVLDDEVEVATTEDPQSRLRTVNIEPLLTLRVTLDGTPVGDLPNLLQGDVITHVDGQPVESAVDILAVFSRSQGKVLRCTVERPDQRDPERSQTLECYQRAVLAVLPANLEAAREDNIIDDCHVLGLRRRRIVGMAEPGAPADKAGFERGDIIAAWGTVLNPTYEEITNSIQANAGKATRVVVERCGVEKVLKVTPKRPFKLFGQARAKVGLEFSMRGEEDKPIVADVVPDTPFAALNMPRGALLLAIDRQPVSNWFEVTEALKAAAGRTIELRYRSGSDEMVGHVDVPSSLVNELDLPPGAIVGSVDGETSVEVEAKPGGVTAMPLPGNPLALRELLKSKVGQTVTVRYSPLLNADAAPIEKQFTVRTDNVDPWQLRVSYMFDRLSFAPAMERVSAGGNPFKAIKMGVNFVVYQIWQVYRFLTKLADRSMSTRNVAGPVGIIGMAIEQAKAGLPELMFFLAFLSVNLAVINFLPMPVLDGGLMVFLLIEKIKGKPLSLKAQMVGTMVGLAAIILGLLFVTIQDIGRFF